MRVLPKDLYHIFLNAAMASAISCIVLSSIGGPSSFRSSITVSAGFFSVSGCSCWLVKVPISETGTSPAIRSISCRTRRRTIAWILSWETPVSSPDFFPIYCRTASAIRAAFFSVPFRISTTYRCSGFFLSNPIVNTYGFFFPTIITSLPKNCGTGCHTLSHLRKYHQ